MAKMKRMAVVLFNRVMTLISRNDIAHQVKSISERESLLLNFMHMSILKAYQLKESVSGPPVFQANEK